MFTGFEVAEQNWFKFPNMAIEVMATLNKSEILVLMYLMRHTWGYHEYGIEKHITLDEFEKGRRTKTGERIDNGTGIPKSSISRALTSLESRNIIKCSIDDTDKARVCKRYKVVIQGSTDETLDNESVIQGSTSGKQGSTSGNRSEKETIERNPEIQTPAPTTEPETPYTLVSKIVTNITPYIRDNVEDLINDYGEERVKQAMLTVIDAGGNSLSDVENQLGIKKQPKPSKPKSEPSPVQPLLAAYGQAHSMIGVYTPKPQDRQRFQAMHEAGITPDRLTEFIKHTLSEDWFTSGNVSPKYIAERIGRWEPPKRKPKVKWVQVSEEDFKAESPPKSDLPDEVLNLTRRVS